MKVLFVWPQIPATFWSYKYALPFISKKAVEPPLGLLTVASMLPELWEKKLIDMNISELSDQDILWADFVFIGAMSIQRQSFTSVVERCKALGTRVVAGGSMCTSDYETIEGVDHFVLNEAEITLPQFLEDLASGVPKQVYRTDGFADITTTPLPMYELLDIKKYALMDIQFSRGCPHNCEFCSITAYLGRRPRLKETDQFLRELDHLYDCGWRGDVFIVDDNFICNRRVIKHELLPALTTWMRSHGNPFAFNTEVTIELADDKKLMDAMADAGFQMVFVGIETPAEESLVECGKHQNRKRDMVRAVHRILRHGLTVTGGFIVGFDNDPPDIFQRQIRFIQSSGIVVAMVGLLNALPGTQLFRRLQRERRILLDSTGNNTDGSLNFIPRMNRQALVDGYRRVLETIYSPARYFERIRKLLSEYRMPTVRTPRNLVRDLRALWRAVVRLGILHKGRSFFWRLLFGVIRDYPRKLPLAVTLAVSAYHFNRVTQEA